MKKYFTILFFFMFVFIGVQSQESSIPLKKSIDNCNVNDSISPSFATLLASNENTVNICHKKGDHFIFKVVTENSLPGHMAHGDFLYKGRPDVYDWEMDDWCNINDPQK